MKIFISYAREDRNAAEILSNYLKGAGHNVWWDASLLPGHRFRDSIQNELNSADKVVVLWSANSVASDFVIDEASHALAGGKLVPFSIDGTPPPLGFRGIQTPALDYASADANSVIAAALAVPNLPELPAAQPLLTPAELSSAAATVERYGVGYANWLLLMMFRPMAAASSLDNIKNPSERIKLMATIIGISVLIGASLGGSIPDRPPLAGRFQILVVVTCLWMFWAILIHFFCRLFGGKGHASTTMLVTLQTLAFTYLVSNFIVFMLWHIKAYYPGARGALSGLGLESPGTALVLLQSFLLLPLIPLTLARVHVFSSAVIGAIVTLLAVLLAALTAAPIVSAGGC